MKIKKIVYSGLALTLGLSIVFSPASLKTNRVEALVESESLTEVPSNVRPELLTKAIDTPDELISIIVALHDDAVGVEEEAEKLGATITSKWDFINAFAATIKAENILSLATVDGVEGINLNLPVKLQHHSAETAVDPTKIANAYNEAVKVHKVWEKGYFGKDVGIAVVDSGINYSSEKGDDLGERLISNVKFSSLAEGASDKYGHGTHVAGTIAGDGDKSFSKYVGIAPKANIIGVKFSGDDGSATEEDLVNSLQWVYDNKIKYNIRVANISAAVGTQQSYKESATAAAVEQLWFGGVVVVVSAGNRGGEECSVCYAPANDPYVISVGAVDDNKTKADLLDDFVKPWSSSGTTLDGHIKPEVMAPGGSIIAYMPQGELRKLAPERIVDTNYFRLSGTSMASPVVAGVAGLMLQVNPTWKPDQVKWVLMNTLRPDTNQAGPGIIQADQAVFYSGTPGSANQGLEPSPYLDSSSNTITYSNMSWSNMSWSNMSWSNTLNAD